MDVDELTERVRPCLRFLLADDMESVEECVRWRTGIRWVKVPEVVLRPKEPTPNALLFVPLLVALSPNDSTKVWTVVAQYDYSDELEDIVATDIFVDESPVKAVRRAAPEIVAALGVSR